MFLGKKEICTVAMGVGVISLSAEGEQPRSTRKPQTAMTADIQCYVEACLEHGSIEGLS